MTQKLQPYAVASALMVTGLAPAHTVRITMRFHTALNHVLRRLVALCLLCAGPQGLRVTEIANRTRLPVYQVSRHLANLAENMVAEFFIDFEADLPGKPKKYAATPYATRWLERSGLGDPSKAYRNAFALAHSADDCKDNVAAAFNQDEVIHAALGNLQRVQILAVLEACADRGARSSELAKQFSTSMEAVRPHLRLLTDAELVKNEPKTARSTIDNEPSNEHSSGQIQSWYWATEKGCKILHQFDDISWVPGHGRGPLTMKASPLHRSLLIA